MPTGGGGARHHDRNFFPEVVRPPDMSIPLRIRALLAVAPLAMGLGLPGAGASGAASATEPVLGSPSFLAPHGEGWGTARPHEIFNGGDPAGDASRIHWRHWGEDEAVGRGLIPIFRPGGGYYARPGSIVLYAEALGSCPDGTNAYTRLYFRVAHRPGQAPGRHRHPWASDDGNICTSP